MIRDHEPLMLRFDYVEDHGEAEPEVVVEEANEGERE